MILVDSAVETLGLQHSVWTLVPILYLFSRSDDNDGSSTLTSVTDLLAVSPVPPNI